MDEEKKARVLDLEDIPKTKISIPVWSFKI